MRVPRIHVETPLAVGEVVSLPDTAARHVLRVLRLRAGDALVLFDGGGDEYRACLEEGGKNAVRARVLTCAPGTPEPRLAITLAQGISRGERMDLVVQKAVELGVDTIQPLATERSVVKLDQRRAASRVAHWQGVVTAACEQSGRARLPAVEPPMALDRWLEQTRGDSAGLVLDPREGAPPSGISPPHDVLRLLVGPEGGLTPAEHAAARSAGYVPMRLGPRILRTETAAIAALTTAQLLWGDLDER